MDAALGQLHPPGEVQHHPGVQPGQLHIPGEQLCLLDIAVAEGKSGLPVQPAPDGRAGHQSGGADQQILLLPQGVRRQGPVTTEELAQALGTNRTYLCRMFREETGETVQDYVTGLKMDEAKRLLDIFTSNTFSPNIVLKLVSPAHRLTGDQPTVRRWDF